MKYIDAEKLIAEVERRIGICKRVTGDERNEEDMKRYYQGKVVALEEIRHLIDSLQQEQQTPNSTQLIAEWEKERAVLEQKDFRGDADRMAYNAFLDGFVKGLGYEGTK